MELSSFTNCRPRAFTLASQIDEMTIAILGGSYGKGKILGEVLFFEPY